MSSSDVVSTLCFRVKQPLARSMLVWLSSLETVTKLLQGPVDNRESADAMEILLGDADRREKTGAPVPEEILLFFAALAEGPAGGLPPVGWLEDRIGEKLRGRRSSDSPEPTPCTAWPSM